MTDQNNTAPAVWDPTARGGAGGWVRGSQAGPPAPGGPAQPGGAPRPGGALPPQAPVHPPQPGPGPGPAGDPGPPPAARPYPAGGPGFDAPTQAAPAVPQAPPGGYGFPPPQGPAQPHGPAQPTYQQPYQQQPPPPGAPPGPPQPPAQSQGFPGHAVTPPPFPAHSAPGPGAPQFPYQQAGGPPGHPGYEEAGHHDEQERPRNRTPLLVAAGLVLVLGIGAGVVWAVHNSSGGSDKRASPAPAPSATATDGQPAPAPTGAAGASPSASAAAAGTPAASPGATASAGANAAAQAKSLDDLLTRGESAKAPIGNAVAKVSSCPAKADIESAAQVFDTGATQRDQLLAELAKLDLGDVPGGADAVQALRTAWQQSADVDRSYAAWARAVSAKGCTGSAPNTAEKKKADELNPQATQSKKDFVEKWKTIAGAYGLNPRTPDRI